MTRAEKAVASAFIAVIIAGFGLLLLVVALVESGIGMPNVLSCIDEKNAYGPPAMSVEVTSNRNGHIVERNLFGCKLYFYEPPGQ